MPITEKSIEKKSMALLGRNVLGKGADQPVGGPLAMLIAGELDGFAITAGRAVHGDLPVIVGQQQMGGRLLSQFQIQMRAVFECHLKKLTGLFDGETGPFQSDGGGFQLPFSGQILRR